MIWLTSGFPAAPAFQAALNRMSQRLNDADIAVYPVDARGLIAGAAVRYLFFGGGSRRYQSSDDEGNRRQNRRPGILQRQRPRKRDAWRTRRCGIQLYIGYYPTNSKNDGAYRNLSVKTGRPGITLRYRTGYEAENNSNPRAAAKIDLQQVFGSPLDATALPLNARAVKANNKLDVFLRIDPATLTLRQENGRRKGAVSVLYSYRPADATGKIQIFSELNKLELPEAQYAKLLQLDNGHFESKSPYPRRRSRCDLP